MAPTWASRSPGSLGRRPRGAHDQLADLGGEALGGQPQALLVDVGGVGGHRAGRIAADVGVVGPVGDPPDQLGLAAGQAGRHQGDVVEMGAAGEGVVEDDLVARFELVAERSMAARTDAGMEPRWTGMFSAWTSSRPCG